MIYPLIIYNIFEYFLNLASQGGQAALSVDKVKDIEGQVLFLLGILQLIFLVITFMLSVFISHRIAGPLYKLRKAMDDVSKGNVDLKITFRKNDHFTELQDSFNDMVQNVSVKKSK